jgi:exodeoxyribonuclease V alpha subunit
MKEEHLYTLYHEGLISNLDLHFARLMARLCGRPVKGLALAAALVSGFTRKGHICLDLSTLAGRQLLEAPSGEVSVVCPELSEWGRNLRESGVVGNPGEYRPLILDDRSRLYLLRYWDYQETLADLIWKLVHEGVEDLHFDLLKEGLIRLFTDDRVSGVDWQKVAAFTALSKRFCVISGGPGTGKTATVAKILALLVEQAKSGKARAALAAPTGKAAVRLQEAIKEAKATLNCSENVKEAVPEEASTLHRLLGSVPGSPYFRYDVKNRLPVDTVIVDEASMVDLPLMSKLTQALPAQARLILLGDKDQLASVEAGAVLGDICDTGHPHGFSKRFCTALVEITGYTIPAEPLHWFI